jgi:hypothetical protein
MKFSSIKRNLLAMLAAVLLVVANAWAQTGTTSLRGTVTDKSDAAIVGANVKISNSQTGFERSTTTGDTGAYEFLALPPGVYTLTVEKESFRKYVQANLELLVNLPATQNVTLQVGSMSQTVEVSAATVVLNTTDASLGNAFNENQVKQLPLEGRNVPDLLSLQPGVAYTGNRADVPDWDTRNGAVNGARSDQSNVTVDGVESNDEGGAAFTSVLPVTLDSVQEFRVTTSNYNADQGGSSGAQVALVTKSGTNDIHGSVYEYNRNTYTSANDYFVKAAQIDNCVTNGTPLSDRSCNTPPKLIRNIFGGSLGGPIKKDRLFLFLNYEGTRRAEAQSVTDVVPSETMKDGVIIYACAPILNPDGSVKETSVQVCPGMTAQGVNSPHTIAPVGNTGYYGLGVTQLTAMDPLHLGPNSPVLQYLNTWPKSNSSACGDNHNYDCYNYSAPISDTGNVYIAKMDYNITRDGKQHVSVMGALRNDNNAGAAFYPGLPPSQSIVNYNKGIVVNYSGVITSNLINNFRYGFVRQSAGVIGNSKQDWNELRGLTRDVLAPPYPITRTHSLQRPTHLFSDDLSWMRGKHTWQIGGQIAFIRTPSISDASSYSDGIANASWTTTSGYAQKKSPLNPAWTCTTTDPSSCVPTGIPAVDASFANSYDFPLTALLGMVTEVDAQYNFQRDGSALSDGTAVSRRFAINSYEMYVQDVWKVKPTFTLTLGLRYSLFSPPWETSGLQVSPTVNMDQWFLNRAAEGNAGQPSNLDPLVSYDWSGKANGRPGFYNWDPKNFGPRVAFAWAPRMSKGVLGEVFGEGKTSIRGGFGMVYDRFGQSIVDDFSQYGSFGLSTELTNPAGFVDAFNAPRLTSMNTVPNINPSTGTPYVDYTGNSLYVPSPPAKFPEQFPTGTFYIGSSIDKNLKTPYAFTLDLSVSRELKGGFTFEAAYVGRLSRRLLMQLDAATPLDLKDKASGLDYFTALTALAKIYRTGVSTDKFNPSMVPANVAQYWADIISPLQGGDAYGVSSCVGTDASGNPLITSTMSPVVAAYDLFCGNSLNETTGLLGLDYSGITSVAGAADPNCGTAGHPVCSYLPKGGQFTFYNPQFATMYMFKSMGTASYNAGQFSLHHKMTHGVQFDFSYTYSKSIDLASDAERVGTMGGNSGEIMNAWSPYQFRGVSDYDATHQITANWIAELPFGRKKMIGGNANGFANAIIGGWQFSGLTRWESGFPFYVGNGYQFPTDWELSGNAIQTAPVKTGVFHSPTDASVVSAFSNFSAAQYSFREPFPGEAGQRNNLRGPGFFSLDIGLAKRWLMPWSERHSLQFRWEVFNVLNAVRFDPLSINAYMDQSGSTFGQYTRLSTNPRVMQFALRYEF